MPPKQLGHKTMGAKGGGTGRGAPRGGARGGAVNVAVRGGTAARARGGRGGISMAAAGRGGGGATNPNAPRNLASRLPIPPHMSGVPRTYSEFSNDREIPRDRLAAEDLELAMQVCYDAAWERTQKTSAANVKNQQKVLKRELANMTPSEEGSFLRPAMKYQALLDREALRTYGPAKKAAPANPKTSEKKRARDRKKRIEDADELCDLLMGPEVPSDEDGDGGDGQQGPSGGAAGALVAG
ncbi:hypothetical protein HKX48_002542 [Thoreauomyces humboldtii]|nr:hypothetical protein HKX48_002542 [Thoreauomyces humboldtii]